MIILFVMTIIIICVNFLCLFCQVGLGQLHYQGGRGVEMDHGVSIYEGIKGFCQRVWIGWVWVVMVP